MNSGNVILDSRRGDVTGDGVPDLVYITGRATDAGEAPFTENITLVIEDGHDGSIRAIKPEHNAGCNPRLFLGDFDGDRVDDIKISTEAGISGGPGIHYIYSFKDYVFRELFNYEAYNDAHQYKVYYNDFYRVAVGNVRLNRLFMLDIKNRGDAYLSQLYRDNGKLIAPVKGAVLPLGPLLPVADERTGTYGLLARQRITGTSDTDTLGYIESLLHWNGQAFDMKYTAAAVPGMAITA